MPNIAFSNLISIGSSIPKSVVFDIADRYSPSILIGIRSVDFYFEGSKITITAADITCYATSTYTTYYPRYTFITALSKTGTASGTMWYSGSNQITNQRLICVFDEVKQIDGIVVNNGHDTGNSTGAGAYHVKIQTSPNTITNTTYNASVSGGTIVYNSTFDKHTTSDVEDPQTLTLI